MCGLRKIPYKGYKYIWDNRREGRSNIKLVLDKGNINISSFVLFSQAILKHVPNLVSDHLCLALSLKNKVIVVRGGTRRFFFEAVWVKEANCEAIICSSWCTRGNHLSTNEVLSLLGVMLH